VGEARPAASDAALDGAYWHAKNLGDLGVVQVTDVAEHDGYPEILGEVGKRGIQQHPITEPVETHPGIGISVFHDGVVSSVVAPDGVAHRAPAPSAKLVEARVGGDPVHPGREAATPVELVQAPDDCDHRLLGGVGGVGLVASDAATHSEDAVVVAAQQLIEAGPVTAAGCCEELMVVGRGSDELMVAKQVARAGSSAGPVVSQE